MGFEAIKPHLAMVVVQIASAFLYFVVEAGFNHGMNPHVYVTYRHIVGGFLVLPLAYFRERKIRPKLTLALFLELFLFALLGVGLTLNMYFASMKYTSPTFVSATVNTIPSLTFVLAVIFRQESLDIRNSRGLAKVIGTALSLAGVMTLTLYRGNEIKSLWKSGFHLSGSANVDHHTDWIRGSILCIASCVSWSIWFISQGLVLKRYPAQLSLATWSNFLGAAQSAIYAAFITRHDPAAWITTSFVDLSAIIFSGLVSSALNSSMLIWCTKVKGPVFVTMFCPLQTLLVVIFAYFILSEKLFTGSILGGITIVTGLYLLLWGKGGKQQVRITNHEQESLPSFTEQKKQTEASTDHADETQVRNC